MPDRTIEDRLREEYFDHLPEIRRVLSQLEAEVRYHSLPILQSLNPYEQLIVRSRVKECESAVKALRRRQEYGTFDIETPDRYSILNLPDLAGVRILVFPHSRLVDVNSLLSRHFIEWKADPVLSDGGAILAYKYSGMRTAVSTKVSAEYQTVPMLIGLFWKVEHSALYKPASSLKGIGDSAQMKELKSRVELALSQFEEEFESFVIENRESRL